MKQQMLEAEVKELKARIETLKAQLDAAHDMRTILDYRLEELVAKVDDLTAERDKWREAHGQACTHWLDQVRYEIAKTEAAKVDKARLRTALEYIADGMGEMSHAEIGRYAPAIARAALNPGKADT
jgi:hypothetical protein